LTGLSKETENFTLCEIKTTDKPLDTLDESDNPAHWAQGRCYAYIVAKEKGLDKIGVMLLYLHRQSREIRVFEETLTFGELERFFNSLVFPFIYGLKKRYDWQHLRNVSIKELTFPFPDFRKGQRIMSGAVYRAIRDGKNSLSRHPQA